MEKRIIKLFLYSQNNLYFFFLWLITSLCSSYGLSFLLLVFFKHPMVHCGLFVLFAFIRVKAGPGSWSLISLELWESVSLTCLSPHWASWSSSGSVDGAFPPAGIPLGWWVRASRKMVWNNVKLEKTSSVPELPSWFIFSFFSVCS